MDILEDVEKLYDYFPLETHKFLKLYYENNGIISDSENLFECIIKFKKFGLCIFEEDDEVNESRRVVLDFKVAKNLFDFLNNNQKLLCEEKKLYNIISGVLNSYLGLKFIDFFKILKNFNIFKNEYSIMKFLKYKVGNDMYDFYFNSNNELFIASKYIYNSKDIIEKILNYKGERVIHSLNQYIKLSYENIIEDEVSNILNTVDKELIEKYDNVSISYYLIRNALFDIPYESCLKNIKDILPTLDINNFIVKKNVAKFYNKVPLVFKGGIIDPNRVVL